MYIPNTYPKMYVKDPRQLPLSGAQDVYILCKDFRDASREMFVVFLLNAAHQVVERHVVSIGTLTESLVHPREVFIEAVRVGAAAIVCVHNHPSGDHRPSEEDKAVTRRLISAGKLLGIPVLDHVVVSANGYERVWV